MMRFALPSCLHRPSLTAALALGAVSPAWAQSPFPAADSPEVRVASIGYRLATAGTDACPRLAPVTGLLLHDRGSYPASLREDVSASFGMHEGIGVLAVVANSPAQRAGLVAGDEIIAIDGALPDGLPPLSDEASHDRVEAFAARLGGRLEHGLVMLTVRRAGETHTVNIARQSGCAAAAAIVPGEAPGAWSDERYAAVTRGLAAVAGDDELAFALGHEMAHVVLGHAAEPRGALAGLGLGGRRSRERESAADELGIALVIRARYDARGAEALLQRLARASGAPFSLTHPSVRARIAAIKAAAVRLSDGQAKAE